MPETDTVQEDAGVAVRHQLSETEVSEEFQGDINDIKLPFIIKNVTLMSPGVWNNVNYTHTEIQKAFQATDWDDEEVNALFYEHDDKDSRSWVGKVVNPRHVDGETIGDLEIVDLDLARKLAYGAKFGISPKVTGMERNKKLLNYTYNNFSVVLDPAVNTTYMNSERESDDGEVQTKDVLVNSTMSTEKDKVEELSDETKEKLADIVSKVEDADVNELSEIIAPFVDMSAEEVEPHIQTVIDNKEQKDKDKIDVQEVAKTAARTVMEEMADDSDEDDYDGSEDEELDEDVEENDEEKIENDDKDSNIEEDQNEVEEKMSDKEEIVNEVLDKVKEELQAEEDEEEEAEAEEETEETMSVEDVVSEVKDELSEEIKSIKDEIADEITKENSEDEEDDDDDEEEKTPKKASQSTGDDVKEMDVDDLEAGELDRGAARHMLRQHSQGF